MAEGQTQRITIARVVGSPFCVAIEDGHKVFDLIVKAFKSGNKATVSFDGVERLTTAFLNAAIGQLYDIFSEEEIREGLLPPEGASQDQLRLLVRVVDNAKRFFAAPERSREVLKNHLGDG